MAHHGSVRLAGLRELEKAEERGYRGNLKIFGITCSTVVLLQVFDTLVSIPTSHVGYFRQITGAH